MTLPPYCAILVCLFRDLGTSLTNLRTLWLSRAGLSDLDGISSVSSLKVQAVNSESWQCYLATEDVFI